jgi:hypothetical protein
VVSHFGNELVLQNVADLQGLLGAKRHRTYSRDYLGALEYQIDGKKELFFPGSGSDYPLREMVLFLNDLHTAVDVRVLVASHDDSVQSKALVESLGGRGAVGKSLHQFLTNLPTFLEAHSSVLFGKGGKAKVKDGENQLVLAIKELCSCGVIKAELTYDPTPLAWVRRDDHRVTLACKAPAVVVEDVSPTLAPCALAFSPPEHTQAPPYPQWLVDCDAANVEHLPLFAVTEVVLESRDKIGGADPSESVWRLVTSLWTETCLPPPFNRTGNPRGLSKADVHGLFRRISRSGGNTHASGYRADLRAKVEVARKSHLERMAKILPLAMVSRLFPERTRLLLHWFAAVPEPLPTAVPVVVEQARVPYLVPYSAEWLNDRQAKWRKKWRGDFSSGSSEKWPVLQLAEQRAAERVTDIHDVPSVPLAVLSKVLPTSRGEDTLVDRFVRGKALPALFDHCVAVVGALPVDESVVELMFSAEKLSTGKTSHGSNKP